MSSASMEQCGNSYTVYLTAECLDSDPISWLDFCVQTEKEKYFCVQYLKRILFINKQLTKFHEMFLLGEILKWKSYKNNEKKYSTW